MGCSHATDCPLFPLLRGSLQSWRGYYCDTESTWLECARYEVALTGNPVPISLLPNGKIAPQLDREVERRRQRAAGLQSAPTDPVRMPRSELAARMQEDADRLRSAAARRPAQPARRESPASATTGGRKRRWWHRITDWMRDPA